MAKEAAAKTRRGTETRKRGHQTLVRWAADEFAAVDEAARARRLNVPSYLREIALDPAARKTRNTRRDSAERELLAKVLGQLGKIGSNLNQIAHAANLDPGERADIGAAVAEVRAMRDPLMEALGRKP